MQALYNFLHKNGIAVAFGLALLAAVTSIIVISSNSISYETAFNKASESSKVMKISDPEAKNEVRRKEAKNIHLASQRKGVGTLIVWGMLLAFIGAICALVFPLIKSLDNPKSLLKFGVSLFAVVVIFLIAYAMSDTDVAGSVPGRFTDGEAKFSGAIVGTLFVFVGLAIAGMIGGEVYRIVKERN